MPCFDLPEEPFNHRTAKNRESFDSKLFLQFCHWLKAHKGWENPIHFWKVLPLWNLNVLLPHQKEKWDYSDKKSFHIVLHYPERKVLVFQPTIMLCSVQLFTYYSLNRGKYKIISETHWPIKYMELIIITVNYAKCD